MQQVVQDPYTCILVAAMQYVTGFARVVADIVMRQCADRGHRFSDVVLCESDPERTLKAVKEQCGGLGGKKIVMILQGPVGGLAVKYLCDDFEKPLEERRVVWIHSLSVGLDYYKFFDHPHMVESIPITNGKRSQSSVLAEHVLYALSYFNRKTWVWAQYKREHAWQKYSVDVLRSQRMLILGYGDIGESTAKLATAYGIEVNAVKRSLPEDQKSSPFVDRFGAKVYTGHACRGVEETAEEAAKSRRAFEEERDRLIMESDYIVNILPGTPATFHFFNKDVFAKMKKTALYVNIGRGCTNNEKDLVEALNEGKIRGAALDVFEVEPLPKDSPLWDVPDDKLMLTSHSAAQTDEQLPALAERFVLLCERWRGGTEIHSEEVNRQFWY